MLGDGRCTRCGHDPTALAVASPQEVGVDDALSPDQRYMATPFQFGLLFVASLGLYNTYWLFKLRRVMDHATGTALAPWYWWLGFFIPILNLFMYFGLLNDLEARVASAGRRPPPLWLPGLIAGLTTIFLRLPGYWWLIAFLDFIPLSIVQANALAWQRSLYQAPSRAHRFRWWEWLIILVGGSIVVLLFLSALVPDKSSIPADPWIAGAVAALILAMLILMAIAGESWAQPGVDPNVKREMELAESNWRASVGSLRAPPEKS